MIEFYFWHLSNNTLFHFRQKVVLVRYTIFRTRISKIFSGVRITGGPTEVRRCNDLGT